MKGLEGRTPRAWSNNQVFQITREDQCARACICGGLGGDSSGADGRSDDYCSDLVSGVMGEEEGTQKRQIIGKEVEIPHSSYTVLLVNVHPTST